MLSGLKVNAGFGRYSKEANLREANTFVHLGTYDVLEFWYMLQEVSD